MQIPNENTLWIAELGAFNFFKKKVEMCTTVATQLRQLHYSNNLSKKKKSIRLQGSIQHSAHEGLARSESV